MVDGSNPLPFYYPENRVVTVCFKKCYLCCKEFDSGVIKSKRRCRVSLDWLEIRKEERECGGGGE